MTRCKSVSFLSVLTLLLWLSSAEASHFRFGNIAWSPTPGSSSNNTVTITFQLAFRRSYSYSYYCDENTKSQGSLIGYGDSWRATCSDASNPQCSTITLADTGFYCNDFSSNEDWSMGENNFTYTFPSYNSVWTVRYTSCCWISLARYGGQWLVSGEIDLTPRSDNGKINSSPVTRSLAIVRFQEGCPKEIRIPVEDPDGDTVKCRWASDAESSIPSDSFPHGLLEETTCVLKYGGGNGTAGTYAATLTLEDFPAGTTNFDNVRPFSAVGLQFLVIISGQSGPCDDIPVFTDSTPEDGECSEIQIGSAYTAVIEVQLADFAKHVVEITTSSPPGMQITPLRYHQGVYYRNVTWYPSQYQFGQNLFCFQAVDSSGLQSSLHCVTILVGLSNTPQVILGSQSPMYPLSEFGPGLIWWSIQFDRVIKKPRSSAYIRLVLQPNSYTVYKVDTLSQYVIIDSNRTVLHFATPKAALSMNGSYAILIDHGAVVGQGCSYDGPPTPGITSPSDWGFPVDGVCPVGSSLAPPGFTNCVDVDECASHSRSKRSFWPSWWPYLFSTSTAAYSGSTASASSSYLSECSHHSYLEDSVRGVGFYNGYYGYYQCDSNLPSGWYRFRGAAGTEMPTSCVGKNRCSSHAPGWLDGSHPSVADGAVHATVCFHWNSGCCTWSKSIRVRNCSGFYVYELGPTPTCWLRYCGNGGANYSTSSVISPTSALHSRAVSSTSASYSTTSIPSTTVISPTPGQTVSSSLVSQYPSECSNHSYLEDADRAMGFSRYLGYYRCDNNLPSGWYRFRGAAGTEMPTSCVGRNRCGTHVQGWLSGSHPSVADGAVHATVCFHWSWGCCSWSTSIRVRNCSGFYVYELGPPPYCYLRYCGNGGASYSMTSIPSTTVISPTPASISPTTSASTTPVSPGSCSYTLTGSRGNFTSPNYPYDYPLSVTCNWTISVTPGYFIYLHFEHFHLEHAYGASECPYDFVEIFDGSSSSSPLIAKRCAYQDSWCVYSTSHVLHVNFVSDFIIAQSGFSAYYERVHTTYPTCLHLNSTLHSRTSTSTPAYFQATSSIPVNGIHPTPASAMPSSFYAASSVNVLPNPSQFELHLPSGCEQICSNTYGSYTCSCVSGYQLALDGKSCLDVDECSISNGGCSHHCFNIPGSFYCGCPEGRTMGANNLTCVEPGVSVDCGDSNMTVALEKRTFPFFEVGQLHLRYSSCRATQNDTHLLVSTTLNGCGTLVNETQDALIFWNEIQADAVIINNVITRTHDIKLPFYCSYSRRKMLSLSFTPQPVFFLTEAGYGNLTFKIDLYKSSSFDTPYSQQEYPLLVELNDYVYVRYSVESSADLTIMAVTCKATKDGSSYSWPQYTIIQNGCPRDTTMDYSYDPLRNFQQFKIKAFRFFDDYDTVYFHCELLACHKYSPNSRCNQGCSIGNKRKKRDVTRDEVEHEESTNKVILTQGPVVFKKEEQQQSGETEQNKQTGALIGGAAAAGGFGLIAFIALAVLFVKYRIARRFMNRNKVGDLYTTQDEQMSRKHAYIQEDDMIDNDDVL